MKIGKYIIVGGSAALTEYVIFLYLNALLGVGVIVGSQIVSFLCGFVVSFALNRQWVFKSNNPMKRALLQYSALAAINLVLTSMLIQMLTHTFGVVEWLAKLGVMGCVVLWNYAIFNTLIFAKR